MTHFEIQLSVRRGRFQLDVQVDAKTWVLGIFGPSGSGKSTLLDALVGGLRPDSGRIALDGEVLFDRAAGRHTATHRRGLALVPQDPLLFPHLSVRGNLEYAPGARQRLRASHGAELLAVLGLEPLLERVPDQLSGGERQRVALGRAVLAGPRALLLDEPLASLDQPRARAILALLLELRSRFELPMVFVSHQPSEHLLLSETCLALDAGRLVAIGSPLETLRRVAPTGHSALDGLDNLLSLPVLEHDPTGGLTWLDLGGAPHRLAIPRCSAAPGDKLRVGVLAEDILLARERPTAISARNVLEARITTLEPIGEEILAQLRIGTAGLHVRLTPSAVRELGLEPGGPVIALIKSTACHRLPS